MGLRDWSSKADLASGWNRGFCKLLKRDESPFLVSAPLCWSIQALPADSGDTISDRSGQHLSGLFAHFYASPRKCKLGQEKGKFLSAGSIWVAGEDLGSGFRLSPIQAGSLHLLASYHFPFLQNACAPLISSLLNLRERREGDR